MFFCPKASVGVQISTANGGKGRQVMGFPGTWMTQSESVVYRVVPKCACSSIGQIMFYSDHGEFFDGDIHDATDRMHKWAIEASQPKIERNVKTH